MDVVLERYTPSWASVRRFIVAVLVGGGVVAAIGAGARGLVVAGETRAEVSRLTAEQPETVRRLRAVETELAGLKSAVESSDEAQRVLLNDILERLRQREQ